MYGIPYKGGKTSEADHILAVMPNAENFYDMFCGGCSITHAAALSHKFEHICSNDLQTFPIELFKSCYNRKWISDKAKHFVTRDEFIANKNKDPFIQIIWSFSSNQKDYVYGKNKNLTKILLGYDYIDGKINELPNKPTTKVDANMTDFFDRYDVLRKSKVIVNDLDRVAVLARCYRLKQIADAANVLSSKVKFTNKSYTDIEVKPNSIIYCDPPYKDTSSYPGSKHFDSEQFYEWAAAQTNPIFVSESYMPDNWMPVIDFGKKLHFGYSASSSSRRSSDILWARKDQL